ncbi:DUF6894 family protein [Mesorhizobium sp. CA4]|uniref:DUF6894 family protein n=1 Tax=Mesorhizobium sp. CA4 TaxID=588499 RepID=UPI001CD0631F|nr:hypothetical protein [Mesorhizobium sp. CA4]MBZ9819729.1 hypothetical protein [Mesorhizobium sp. CA4]
MARFFFDVSHSGDVYHDARGANLPGLKEAKERAFEVARRLVIGGKDRDVVCTIRDITGSELMQLRIQCAIPVKLKHPSLTRSALGAEQRGATE